MELIADIKDYHTRVESGKRVEIAILQELRKIGINIAAATLKEDWRDKIDGWLIDKNGDRHSVQIKYRESGNDILFEVVKDWDLNLPGRDSVSRAEFYLIVNRLGNAKLLFTAPIKKKAQAILQLTRQSLIPSPQATRFTGNQWEVKITTDRAHGQRKLMAYFSPRLFETIGEWNLNV